MAADRPNQLRTLWAVVLGALALYAVAPLAGWLVVGVWLGVFGQSWHRRLTRAFLGHRNFAAFVAVALLVAMLVPAVIAVVVLLLDLIAFVQRLAQSHAAHEVLQELVARSGSSQQGGSQTGSITHLLIGQVDRAWSLAIQVIGATAYGVLGFFLLIIGVFVVLLRRAEWYAWLEQHMPLMPPRAFHRFAEAFSETGRGMFYAIVVAGLFHAALATISYYIVHVPDALALGALTLVFSVVPVIGTAAVWIPVGVGLAVEGRFGAAIFIAIWSLVVVGILDHFLRPYVARRGKLALPFYVLLVAMAGGAEVFGAWGLIYGPLLVRLAKEALVIAPEAYTDTRHHGTA